MNEEQQNQDEQEQNQPQNEGDAAPQPGASEQQSQNAGDSGGDASEAKVFGIIGYIFPILFFLPMVTDAKNNSFAMFHANQQLNLLLFNVIGFTVSGILVFVLIGILLMPLVALANLVFLILGIVNVVNEEKKRLPVIGGFDLINS